MPTDLHSNCCAGARPLHGVCHRCRARGGLQVGRASAHVHAHSLFAHSHAHTRTRVYTVYHLLPPVARGTPQALAHTRARTHAHTHTRTHTHTLCSLRHAESVGRVLWMHLSACHLPNRCVSRYSARILTTRPTFALPLAPCFPCSQKCFQGEQAAGRRKRGWE